MPSITVMEKTTTSDLAPWMPEEAKKRVNRNVIVTLFGATKTGKSHFATHTERPLYYAFLDPNNNLDALLLKSSQVFEGPIYPMVIPSLAYDLLTQDEAERRVKAVEGFAAKARAKAREDLEAGRPTGTFVLDGAVKFKGYVEKWMLGESATLGWRAARGERGGPSTFDYAKSNAYIMDFISAFAGSPLDVIIIWEGRRVWAKDESGQSVATNRFKTSMPELASFAINAEIETLVEMVPIVVDNRKQGEYAQPKVRIGWNAYGQHLRERTLPAKSFKELKDLFFADLDLQEKVLDPPHEVTPANTEGLAVEEPDG